MLLCAEERAYISVYNERLEMFREYLEKMVSEGKKVVIVTNEPFDLQGATVYLTECKKEHPIDHGFQRRFNRRDHKSL